MPSVRITSRPSTLSAPAAIPPMIEVSLPAGFTAADRTLVAPIATRSSIQHAELSGCE
jgi:hypothetical protein